MILLTRSVDKSICISFLIEDEELLKRYNQIWDKVSNSIKKEFDIKLVEKEKHLPTKIKSCNDKPLKEGCRCIFVLMILIDSFLKTYKNFCQQMFLEKCKYIKKR